MFKKHKFLLLLIIVCLSYSGILFYYNKIKIPKVIEKTKIELQNTNENGEVITMVNAVILKNEDGLKKYTKLNDEIIKDYFEVREIPSNLAINKHITSTDMLSNKVLKEDLEFNEQVSLNDLADEKKWFTDYERQKEYKVKTLVADTVKEGNIVDLIINYGNGDYDVILPKVKVEKIISPFNSKDDDINNNVAKRESDKDFIVIFNIEDESIYAELELAKELGYFETRLYIDESQPASKKTFDYNKALEKLNITKDRISTKIKDKQEESKKENSEEEKNKIKLVN